MAYEIEDPDALIESLCGLGRETDWVEFKRERFIPENVGRYVSSLANSAIIHEKDHAFLVFGVDNDTHEVVGTDVNIDRQRKGAEPFLLWLNKYLEPHIRVQHHKFQHKGKQVEMLSIQPPYERPVKFQGRAYIRVEAAQQELGNHPEIERAIWAITSRYAFETTVTEANVTLRRIVEGYEYAKLLTLLGKRVDTVSGAISQLEALGLFTRNLQKRFDVRAIFGISCAKDMNAISLLENKGVRVTTFKDKDKLDRVSDIEGQRGYAISFELLMIYIMDRIPHRDVMRHGIRTTEYKIPEITMREFVANAIIHQDFTRQGERPTVEIYSDKVRIINPGTPLVPTDRFIDSPSKSRNPKFATLMRTAGLCEQLGSGVDKALREVERAMLPPPLIQSVEGSTSVTIFMNKPFNQLTADDRVRACYQHACLMYEAGDPMSNGSLRVRLGLGEKQYPQVSNVIGDAIAAGRIRPLNEGQANRIARYVPYWA